MSKRDMIKAIIQRKLVNANWVYFNTTCSIKCTNVLNFVRRCFKVTPNNLVVD